MFLSRDELRFARRMNTVHECVCGVGGDRCPGARPKPAVLNPRGDGGASGMPLAVGVVNWGQIQKAESTELPSHGLGRGEKSG